MKLCLKWIAELALIPDRASDFQIRKEFAQIVKTTTRQANVHWIIVGTGYDSDLNECGAYSIRHSLSNSFAGRCSFQRTLYYEEAGDNIMADINGEHERRLKQEEYRRGRVSFT
jgi:hypothetical protein